MYKKMTLAVPFLLCFLQSFSQNFRIDLVKDINPGGNSSYPRDFLMLNNKLVFMADSGMAFIEPWITDGTIQGTTLLKDINATQGCAPHHVSKCGSNIFFSANDGIHYDEPWTTDGTANGTYLIKDLKGGNTGSNPQHYTLFNGKIYFDADTGLGQELFVTDGTVNGTAMLKNIGISGGSYPMDYVMFNNRLYFSAEESSLIGRELWCTDGTSTGTILLKDISTVFGGAYPNNFFINNNKLYFSAIGDNIGRELWVSDGTTAGTVLLKDINQQTNTGSNPSTFGALNNKTYFFASDGINGNELWCIDGDSVYTLKNINANGDAYPCSSTIEFHQYNGKLFFGAHDGTTSGCELWVTNGTDTGTYKIISKDTISIEEPRDFLNWNGQLLFTAGHYNRQLWVSNGTTTGTNPVLPLSSTQWNALGSGSALMPLDSDVYFAANYSNALGKELYKLSIDTTTSITVTPSSMQLSVYPNPFRDILNLSVSGLNGIVEIRLNDVCGRTLKVFEQRNNINSYELSNLPPGIYFLYAKTGDGIELVKKIVKQ